MKELRRNLSILKWSGVATIVFEIWSIVKFALFSIYNPDEINKLFDIAGDNDLAIFIVWVFVIMFMLIDAFFRIYVGRTAIKASKGKPITNFYLTIAIIILLFTLYTLISNFTDDNPMSKLEVFALSFIVDASSAFINIELIVAAIKVKGLTASDA